MDAAAPLRPRRARQAGLTLVEVMVAVGIGLFLVAVASSLYLGSKSTYNAQDAVARLQENGRFAIDTVLTDARMAGARGCKAMGADSPLPVNTLAPGNAFPYDYDKGIFASRADGSNWNPPLPDALTKLAKAAPAMDGDVLVVYRPTGTGWGVITAMADGNAPIVVSSTTDIQLGDVLMVSDCRGSAVFQATSITSPAAGRMAIGHLPATGFVPGVATSDLKRAFDNDAVVTKLTTDAYYLSASLRPERAGALSLFLCDIACLKGLETSTPTELVTGVEHFLVMLGIDSGTTPGSADRYLTPDAVANWNQVVGVKLQAVLASAQDNVATAPQPYKYGPDDGTTVTPTDKRLRIVMAGSANVRNH